MRFFRQFLKLLAITLIASALIVVIAVCQTRPCFEGSESYSFFVGNTSKNCKEVRADSNAALKKLTLSNVCGECAEYSEFDFESYLKSVNGEIVFVEELSDSVNYYCKADLPYSVNLYGEEINLHVCVKSDSVKVGTPIIFGGY
ncbi:MAG: hypothetical protein K2N23_00090 [Clostridia bacterium]|nr:hypothetical protein [Clostridia bacterium]